MRPEVKDRRERVLNRWVYPAFVPAALLVLAVGGLTLAMDTFVPAEGQAEPTLQAPSLGSTLAFAQGEEDAMYQQQMSSFSSELPAAFKQEVFEPLSKQRCYAARDGLVVGVEQDVSARQLAAWIAQRMEQQGWKKVESGQATHFTLVKEVGQYGWAYVAVSGNELHAMAVISLLGTCEKEDGDGE